MKLGVPWSVKGIRPEVRETAREAARRSGLPLSEWLNSLILHQGAQEGINPDAFAHGDGDSDEDDRPAPSPRSGPAAYAPKHIRNDADELSAMIDRLDRRLEQFVTASRAPAPAPAPAPAAALAVHLPPALDRAVAEISARQRALRGESAPAPHHAPPSPARQAPPAAVTAPRPPLPAQDLSGLEEQLRAITGQIEILRRPGVDVAINALRDELGEICRTLTDALPRRALDTIEQQISGLSQRIAEGRQAGIDSGALAGIEHGLAEVRDALRTLTPAESLIGFNDAIVNLAHKIDTIVARQDPAMMHHLEHAINALRDISAHVASNEAVGQLAAEVQQLAQNVEHIAMNTGSGDMLAHIEHRIAALADALAQRTQGVGALPPELETLVHSLTDKIDRIQFSQGDGTAMASLEARIGALLQRLEASDSRLGQLEAIERGLTELLAHVEEINARKPDDAPAGAAAPAFDQLKSDIARTQNALDAVHGTLGQVVDRLGVIERGIHGAPVAPPPLVTLPPAVAAPPLAADMPDLKEPVDKFAGRFADAGAMPAEAAAAQPVAHAPAAPPAPARMPAATQLPIDPMLPVDEPLEPGSGRPSMNAAARIAASEAALGGARPAAAAVPSNKSNFIAAARRAAQAAAKEPPPRAPRTAAEFMLDHEVKAPPLRARLIKRVKSLFLAASLIAIVVGGVQLASNFVNFTGRHDQLAQKIPPTQKIDARITDKPQDAAPQLASTAAVPLALQSQSIVTAAPGQASNVHPALAQWPVSNASPTALVTGSIGKPTETAAPTAAASDKDRLPAAIGSSRLRNAALAGDAAAAYEIAERYDAGRGVPANITEAARWYERAADKGLAPAQFRFGSLLEKGQGVKKDLPRAWRFYLAAAKAGNAKAMHNLAVLYAEGIDGKPDYVTAVQWFRKAAERAVADSQFNLGVLYARGLGVTTNFAESYKWFSLAASKGDKEATKKRDEVAARLDPQALAAAQLAVKNFVAVAQPDAAINVAAPAGGWDKATAAAAPAKPKPHIGAPLVLGNR